MGTLKEEVNHTIYNDDLHLSFFLANVLKWQGFILPQSWPLFILEEMFSGCLLQGP